MLSSTLSKITLLALSCALVASSSGCSKREKTSAGSTPIDLPTIQIPEPKHDFGEVLEGGKLTHVFVVKNAGGGALHIDNVRTSCGCTAAVLKEKDIPPGGEGQVQVTFDTNHRGGDQHKTITVASNDPIKPNAELEIHVNVKVALAFDPPYAQLNSELGKPQVLDTWLTGKFKDQARLKIVEKPSDPRVSVKVVEQTLDGGVGVQGLRFAFSAKQSGDGNANVKVETGLPSPDKLEIGCSWSAKGNVEVSPPVLFFMSNAGDAPDKLLHVTSRRAGFKLRQVRVASGPFVAKLTTLDGGNAYDVHVSLKPGTKPAATATTETHKLELFSNDPLEPRKDVTVTLASNPSAAVSAPTRQGPPPPPVSAHYPHHE